GINKDQTRANNITKNQKVLDIDKKNTTVNNGANNSNASNSVNGTENSQSTEKEYPQNTNWTTKDILDHSLRNMCKAYSDSLNYCNNVIKEVTDEKCLTEDAKNLCCSISDHCSSRHGYNTPQFLKCTHEEFYNTSYTCFYKNGSKS
ncbi:duffy binding protein, putative, partial [Hepatocystis sp. ex Piliocolobus tephrosceles]